MLGQTNKVSPLRTYRVMKQLNNKQRKYSRGAMKKILLTIIGLIFAGCTSINDADLPKKSVKDTAKNYFNVYAQRRNFDQLMSFYHDDAVLEDIIYGNYIESKADIKAFLNWSDSQFSLKENQPTLVINNQTVEDNRVVTEGYFTPFNYAGEQLGPWRFVILLEFNQDHLITKQVDWINYTPRSHYLGGENMNERIKK